MILRPIACLALAGSALAPALAPSAHAASTSVTLRYHYVAGQSYGYKLSATARAHVAGLGAAAAPQNVSSTTGVVRYHIVSVDQAGAATADISTSALQVRATANGQTRTVTVPATKQRAVLGADGSQRGSVGSTIGAVGVQTLGTLPPGNGLATVGGPSWTSKATVTLPSSLGASLPPFRVTTTYRLSSLQQQGGSAIATIAGVNSNTNAPYKVTTTVQGTTVSLRLQETTNAQTLFNATAGRLVSSTARQTLHLTIGQGGATTGSGATISEDITTDTSLTPA